jgi:thiol:disulfide interchange protein DsbA
MARLLAALLILAATAVAPVSAAEEFERGFHYLLLEKMQKQTVPAGKVEVLEVFSYGCSACNSFNPVWNQLKSRLSANAQAAYLPASFLPHENWGMFQRAYLTAVSLGVAEKAHDAMYEAIWKTGELGIIEPGTHNLKQRMPSIEDAAKFYARVTGVNPEKFVATAKSSIIDGMMIAADNKIIEMKVTGTPTVVVAGKYRVNMESLKSIDQFVALVNFLVEKETPKAAPAAPVAPKTP